MRKLASLWPALASAILYLAAFPPINLVLMVFLALVPLLVALKNASTKRALVLGYTFGFFFWAGHMEFLIGFVHRWTDSWALALIPYLLACLLGAWYFALFGWLARRCWQLEIPWLIPFLWVGIEVFRSYIPALAYPWGLLATPLWPFPGLIQAAYFGSIFLISFWAMIPNLLLANWMLNRPLGRLRPMIIVFGIILALSFVRYNSEEPTVTKVVTVGQLGVDLAFGDPAEEPQRIAEAVEALYFTALANDSDLLVLPEGIARGGDTFPPETPFRVEPEVSVVFGGQRGSGPVYQSAYAYDGEWQVVDKTRLVIFGEYVPLRQYLPFIQQFSLPQGDLSPGERVETLDVEGLEVGPVLCFEALFPDIAYRQAIQGAEILAVLAVDDWYVGTTAPERLKAASVWRAVETGLPLVRSTPLGYTFATDGRGRVLSQAPAGELSGVRVELPVGVSNPFPLFPAFPVGSVLLAGYLLIAPWLPWFKRPRD